jgi:hypothetical protein
MELALQKEKARSYNVDSLGFSACVCPVNLTLGSVINKTFAFLGIILILEFYTELYHLSVEMECGRGVQ